VYSSIIMPAVMKAGYAVKRSDIAGEPGNITHDIIRDLANSDVVIADLTSANANVFFELGIRHAFRKAGTVHIVDASHDLPFDVRQYRVIKYSTDLADIPQIIDQIAEAILRRQAQPERADNPVHDAIAELPMDIRSTGDAALKQKLKQTQEALEAVQRERDDLHKRLLELDPAGSLGQEPNADIDALLDDADKVMKSTGEYVLLRLRAAISEGGAEAFVRALRNALRSSDLDQNDYVEMVKMCMELGLDGHRRATLEVATKRYPSSTELFLALADAYDDSPNPAIQERGRLMLEEHLGVVYEAGKPKLAARPPIERARAGIGILLNAYRRLGKPGSVLSLAQSAETLLGPDTIWARGQANALHQMGREEEARDVFQRAISLDPTDDTTLAIYSDFLDDIGQYQEAYSFSERAIVADPEDPRRYLNHAIQILNRGFVRSESGELVGPLPRKQRLKSAIPFIVKALEIGGPSVAQDIVRLLVRADAVSEAQAIARGEQPKGTFDTWSFDFVQKQISQAGEASNTMEIGPGEEAPAS
jgi:uncharacterized protein (TIGR02996 family)